MELLGTRLCIVCVRKLPLWEGPALGCVGPAASSSCTGGSAAHNTASDVAANLPLPQPGVAAGTPSAAPATLASPALVWIGSHSAPGPFSHDNTDITGVQGKKDSSNNILCILLTSQFIHLSI